MFYKKRKLEQNSEMFTWLWVFRTSQLQFFQSITLSDNEKFKLFDYLVGSVLSYSSEVWLFQKAPDVERIHTLFCMNLLGGKKSTHLSALYCELRRKLRIIG